MVVNWKWGNFSSSKNFKDHKLADSNIDLLTISISTIHLLSSTVNSKIWWKWFIGKKMVENKCSRAMVNKLVLQTNAWSLPNTPLLWPYIRLDLLNIITIKFFCTDFWYFSVLTSDTFLIFCQILKTKFAKIIWDSIHITLVLIIVKIYLDSFLLIILV